MTELFRLVNCYPDPCYLDFLATSKARFLRAERGGFLSVLELFAGSGLRAALYLVEGAPAKNGFDHQSGGFTMEIYRDLTIFHHISSRIE